MLSILRCVINSPREAHSKSPVQWLATAMESSRRPSILSGSVSCNYLSDWASQFASYFSLCPAIAVASWRRSQSSSRICSNLSDRDRLNSSSSRQLPWVFGVNLVRIPQKMIFSVNVYLFPCGDRVASISSRSGYCSAGGCANIAQISHNNSCKF